MSADAEQEIALLRAALDHIANTALQSRTSTRRLRWIESRARCALAGRPYIREEHDLPKYNGDSAERQRHRATVAEAEVARLQALLASQQGAQRLPAPEGVPA